MSAYTRHKAMPGAWEISRIQSLAPADAIRCAAGKGCCQVSLHLLDCVFSLIVVNAFLLVGFLFCFCFEGLRSRMGKGTYYCTAAATKRQSWRQLPTASAFSSFCSLDLSGPMHKEKTQIAGPSKVVLCFKADKGCVSHSLGEKYTTKCLSS